MIKFLNKLKLYFRKFLFLFPSPLPIGLTEFETWTKSINDTYGWPDNDSLSFALATMVINHSATTAYRSKYYFGVLVAHAAASKQVAGEVFYQLKQKQRAEALAANKLAEATATSLSVVANESAQK